MPQPILNQVCIGDSFGYDLKVNEYSHYGNQYGDSSKS
jgi:hypothetical protein